MKSAPVPKRKTRARAIGGGYVIYVWNTSQCVTEDGTNKCKHSLKVFLRTLIALMTDFRLELSQKRLFCRVILICA